MTGTHTAAATVTVNQAAYDVTHPAVTIWATGWEASNDPLFTPVGTGAAAMVVGDLWPRTGAQCLEFGVRFNTAAATTTTLQLVMPGLTIGRSYTFTVYGKGNQAYTAPHPDVPDTFKLGALGMAYGPTVTLSTTTWRRATVTFTATATSHTLVISATEASTTLSTSYFYLDDALLVQDPWVEHFPAVPVAVVPVSVTDTDATLDDAWAPFGQVRLEIARPPEQTLEFLDPRRVPAPRVDVTLSDGTVSRLLQLVLRERAIDHAAATVMVLAETDEALLIDLVRVATTVDTSARAYQANLRALINAIVLAPIGAVLAADAGATADLTVYADQANLLTNPSFETNVAGWTATNCTLASVVSSSGYGANVGRLHTPTSSSSWMRSATIAVTPGKTYVFGASGLMAGTGSEHARARRVYILDPVDTALANTAAVPNTSTWTRVTGTVTIPAGVTSVTMVAYLGHSGGAGLWDALKFAEQTGADDDTYFDGSTTDTATYRYDWSGTAHASTSTRTNLTGNTRDIGMFDWAPGVSAWDFVQPLVQAGALRLFCDELRVWHLVNPSLYTVPGLIQINGGANATEARDTISRYGEWFDSVVYRYEWTDAAGIVHTQYDTAGIAPSKTRVVDERRPFPGVGAAAALLNRAKARGRVLDLAAVSDYRASPGMSLQATLPQTPTQLGLVSSVKWNVPGDEMTIGSRELTDVPVRAWVLQPVGKKWTDVPAGTSWNTYV